MAQAKDREALLPQGEANDEHDGADDDGGFAEFDEPALHRDGGKFGGEGEGNEEPVVAPKREGETDDDHAADDNPDRGKLAVAHGQRHEDGQEQQRDGRDKKVGPFEKAGDPGKLIAHGGGMGGEDSARRQKDKVQMARVTGGGR